MSRVTVLTGVIASLIATVGLTAPTALAAIEYVCPLSDTIRCRPPLTGSLTGDVQSTSDGYAFNLSGDRTPGYINVAGSSKIAMNAFPITFSVQVKDVGVPSDTVGDYDVVRGTPSGNWKIEVVARTNRTIAKAACFFKGVKGKGNAVGGPDLSKVSGWTTVTCTNTGTAVQLSVDNTVVKSVAVATGAIPNPGPLLIGAKDTTGGDQYSGYAKDVRITVP